MSAQEVYERLEDRQTSQKMYHDRCGVRELSELHQGQNLHVRDPQSGKWSPATIKDKCTEPGSYLVTSNNGNILRCNRCHLRDGKSAKRVRFTETPQEHEPPEVPRENIPPPRTCPDVPRSQETTPVSRDNNHEDGYRTRSGRAVRKPSRLVDQ